MTDIQELWTDAFLAEVDKRKDNTPIPPEEWRAGGRVSKAWPNKEDATWWLTEGPALVERWQGWWAQAQADGFRIWTTPTGLPGVELAVNVNLGGQMVRGYIDAVLEDPDGDLICVDWKTGREPEAPIQLGFYKVAIEQTFKGVEVKWGAYYMARKADLSHVYDLSIYTPNLVGDWMKKTAAMQNQGLYIPKPSSLCGACGVRSFCKVMGGERAHEVPDF